MAGRLDYKIDLHDDRNGTPIWTGTLAEFWEANEEMTFGEIREIADLLEHYGEATVGGGAAAETFITRA